MRLLESEAALTALPDEAVGLLATGDDVRDFDVTSFRRVRVRFAAFRDGRGFSIAARLRARGWRGELIAEGDVLPDQAIHLARTGYDAVLLPEGSVRAEWERALGAFSAAYHPAADGEAPVWARRAGSAPIAAPLSLEQRARELDRQYRDAEPEAILRAAVEAFRGRIAVLSSFGAEAAVSLHMVAKIDAATPVLFIDTDRHFAPTLQYRKTLAERLGLSDVRDLRPAGAERADPRGDLWRTDADRCCHVRKVVPLAQALPGFEAVITGRKRFHGGERLRLPVFEAVDGRIKVNPLAGWTAERVAAYFEEHALPRHPLVEGGYTSIGCWPCTAPVQSEDVRAGRWAGTDKRECGIHLPAVALANGERLRA